MYSNLQVPPPFGGSQKNYTTLYSGRTSAPAAKRFLPKFFCEQYHGNIKGGISLARSDPAFCFIYDLRLCLLTSNMSTAAATAAFRDSALPCMGMIT